MTFARNFRPLALGAAAAAVVVGAYAWGHLSPAAAASPPSSQPAPSATATVTANGNSVSVSGTGTVTGTPNLLRLQASVDVTKPDVNAAMREANATMAKVQQTLETDGVAAADLQTSGLSVQPNYSYPNGAPKLNGYQVSENLSAVLRDISKAGSIISDAASTGGDELRISGASLDLDSDDALVAQARQQAFADAKAKAQAYAKAAGRSLGTVTSISESSDNGQPEYYPSAATGAADSLAVPVEAGSQDVIVTVSVVWALN